MGAMVVLLAGCTTTDVVSLPQTGDPLADGKAAIALAPARDKVLWKMRTSAVAMRRGDYPEAKRLLDEVIFSIGGIVSKDKDAKKARGVFHEEARKSFHGEPYEQVMAYYYRGILYWMDGEPDNARACFRTGQLVDSDTENKEYSADYVLLYYLDGLASVKLAGDGGDAFNRSEKEAHWSRPPRYDSQANVLIFAEYGNGPTKYGTGEYGEQLRFLPGSSNHRGARFRVNNLAVALDPYDDLNFQATTRGGRVMDHILGNKAVFKTATDVAGDVGLVGGLLLASQRETRDAGIGLAAAGLVSKIISSATTPAADTRCWQNLPEYLSFGALRLPPGQYTASVDFLPSPGSPISVSTKTLTFTVADASRDTVLFVSDKSQ